MEYKTLTFKVVIEIEENQEAIDVHSHVIDVLFDNLVDCTIISDDIRDSNEDEIKEFEDEKKLLEDDDDED